MHVTRTLRSSVLTKFEVLIKLVFQSGLRPRNRSRYRAASCRRRTWRPPPSTAAPGRVRAGTDRYRAWSLLVPRSPLSCRRPRGRQEQALAGARSSRVLDRHSTRRRIQRAAGAKGWLRRTKQKDRPRGQKALFTVPGHPFTSTRRPFYLDVGKLIFVKFESDTGTVRRR